jgi:hypothetical protein
MFAYFFGEHSFEQPRYLHPHFKEVTTRAQLNRAQRAPPPLAAAMMRLNMPQAELSAESAVGSDAPKAEDYLSALREARRSKLASNSEAGGDGTTSTPSTLAERLEARRAAQGNDGGQRPATEAKNKEVDVASGVRNILKDQASKAEFVKKMSRTFGYGMPSNAEPKTDTLAAEAEKCALLVKSSKSRQKNHNSTTGNNRKSSSGEGQKSSSSSNNKQPHKSRPSAEARKAAKAASSGSREREVQPWDFGKDAQQQLLHSSVAPLNPLIDIQIDPELDFLLAELEQDEDFAQLNENEQKTWLESLFFQDTLHCPGRLIVRLYLVAFSPNAIFCELFSRSRKILLRKLVSQSYTNNWLGMLPIVPL